MFLKKEELKNDLHRENFSRYLPWLAYDGEFYYNQDDTVGFILMSMPTYIAGGKIFDSLKGLLSYSYPNKTIIQFILTADDYIEPFLIEYERRKVRANPLVRKAIEKYKNFLRESAKAGKVRQFRFFVAVKCPMSVGREKMVEIKENFVDRFKGMGMPVELLPPEGLLGWLRYIFNRELNGTYDENVFIKDQVITKRIEQDFNKFMLGERYGKTFTVKAFPKEINDLTSNLMSGGIWGAQSDLEQIKGNFILSFNFIYEEDLKNKLLAKGNYILFQKGFLGFAQSLAQKQEEVNWMIKSMNEGEKFIRVIPSVVVFGENESNLKEVVSSVKRVFEGLGFYMQEEYGINLPIFLLSLPHGLYYEAVKDINRDFIFSISTATRLIPLQADFAGNGASLVLIGRKGQIGGIDIFDKNAINYNMVITASSGAGKSFFVNYIVFNVYAEGGIIRIIDIGGSYKKLVKMLGAKYIDIAQEQVCLNPFSFIKEEEDFKGVVSVVSSMANVEEESIEYRLIQDAVRLAYEQEGNEAGIDSVWKNLTFLDKYSNILDDYHLTKKQFLALAQQVAYKLNRYTTKGEYGRYFNGKASFDIAVDELVVLELEKLKTIPDLFKVMTLQVVNAMTTDLYLSDRKRPRMIIFDEAWQFMGETSHLKGVIEEGYRKARKYFGSFVVVLQSDLDLINFGRVGQVIISNSNYKIKLQSPDYDRAKENKIIDYDDFTMKLLKSVKSMKGQYSELFIDAPNVFGIGRLVVDRFSYYIYTSDAKDISKVETLVEQGYSYEEAIERLIVNGG